ncbi:hypothetical protein TNCV_2975991 [Trichonephila clavipes]|nr:hypothetical protein TNCV_2975991 [Trichonephila clavipes]
MAAEVIAQSTPMDEGLSGGHPKMSWGSTGRSPSITYIKGGQLLWFEGYIMEAEDTGGSKLLKCTDEGVLVCRRIVSTRNLPPQSIPHIFNGLDLENALAIRDVEYPRCLDNPEQRVFDDMLRCRP